MLQILTYLLAFYVVIKGIEILQIALASPRQDRSWIIVLGVLVLGACIITAFVFVAMQDHRGIGISASRRHPRIAWGSIRGVDCNACNADST